MIATNGHNYTKDDARWGKYDSGFHAWLVECCEPDEYDGDTDFGGCYKYGKYVDYWTSTGFHSLVKCDSYEEARNEFQAWSDDYRTCGECGEMHGFEERCEESEPETCDIHPGRPHKTASYACELLSQENYYGTE